MASQNLMKVLTTPSKIASALDWRKVSGSVLSLDIHKDRIGLAVASHPSYREETCAFESIPLARKGQRVTKECKARLSAIVKEHRVCGVVVSWPLQEDTGKMGAACGRVLYTLDHLLQDTNIVTPNRPLCLWDGDHSTPELEDEWGRCQAYCRTSNKTVHKASEEQYHQDENQVAATVWDDFCRTHWPAIYQQEQPKERQPSYQYSQRKASSSLYKGNWEDSTAYVNAALL
jgi:RNase H-fold protein (predicted Holliday junction resolvase)